MLVPDNRTKMTDLNKFMSSTRSSHDICLLALGTRASASAWQNWNRLAQFMDDLAVASEKEKSEKTEPRKSVPSSPISKNAPLTATELMKLVNITCVDEEECMDFCDNQGIFGKL